jgi:hypothetical protein
MENRESATCRNIATEVYGDDLTDDSAIEQMARRTNETLVEMRVPIMYRCGAGRIYKEVAPE